MCSVKIESPTLTASFDINPSADWLACLIPALIAGLPAFIDAFMKCIAAGNSGNGYTPGDRQRCGQQTQPPAK